MNKNNPWKPVLQYFIFGFTWILFSDSLLSFWVKDSMLYSRIQTFKGWFYILSTSILLYFFIKMDNAIIYNLNDKLTKSNKHLKDRESLIKVIFEQSSSAIMIWSTDGTIIDVNKQFTSIFGYDYDEVIGQKWQDLIVLNLPEKDVNDLVAHLLRDGYIYNSEKEVITRDGETLYISWNNALLDYDLDGKNLIASYGSNISKEKYQAEKIYKLAYIDTLTSLDNRAVLEQDIESLIYNETSFTVYLIGVDNFKHLNEVHGHDYGNQFLVKYSAKIKHALIHTKVYRWTGDQFAVIETTVNKEAVQLTLDNLRILSHRDWDLNGVSFHSTVSIGVANYPYDAVTADNIYRNIEIALYAAKEKGKACYQHYHDDLLKNVKFINFVESELNSALENNELELYFQPIYNLQNNHLESYEVLLRWFTDKLPNLNIGSLIEIAEKTEQIRHVDLWVIRHTFALIKKNKALLGNIIFSVNLSSQSFNSASFINELINEAQHYDIDPSRIQLEITEHTLIEDLTHASNLMRKLRSKGFKLALDDFGTRYSSLNYLSKLPFDTLKIDKSYIDNILHDANDYAITKYLIQLSDELNLKVVAEGIEDQQQFDTLLKIGCHLGQGYLMSKPYNVDVLLSKTNKTANF